MIAYELREAYRGDVEQVLTVDENGDAVDTQTVPRFTGGVVRAGDSDLNIADLLAEGNGRIVIDPATIEGNAAAVVLDNYPALKRVSAGDDPANVALTAGKTVRDLRDDANVIGLELEPGIKRDALAAGLAEHARRLAAGDVDVVPGEGRTVTIKADGSIAVVATTATPEA